MNKKKELLKVTEVAKLFNISPVAVYTWAEQGKIPCYKLAGAVRFERAEINKWLKSKRKGG